MNLPPTALIADDEPLLREGLARMLAQAWPELRILAQARNGREAVEQYRALRPQVCFLDVHMPGLSGIDAARQIGREPHLVFVTAYDRYAVQAFEHGALDYLVKPVEAQRLADTVGRLRQRLHAAQPAADAQALLERLAAQLRKPTAPSAEPLRWLRVSVGQSLRLIDVDTIDFLRSDDKYTRVAWRDEGGRPAEALIRTPLKEVSAQLDPRCYVQVHRAVVVNLRAISHVTREANETGSIHLKGRDEILPVSRSYWHHFRQM
ncbi:LytR/AlgR family response regulator transcription factor [Pseudomonas sp. CGJS7]|uniref:LytR/AlgR family response regulator transcription factor n=1 Tax=Pseudomonas sp. CGJS7 TaxID=3109348 RepID=UPI00300B613B